MSSFKRKEVPAKINGTQNKPITTGAVNTLTLPLGTKLSPNVSQLLLTSSGMSSLDGVIGGGLPIGTLGVVIADKRTSYARTALTYFISQGIMHQHGIAVVSAEPEGPKALLLSSPSPFEVSSTNPQPSPKPETKEDLTIAWRYKDLPKVNQTQPPPEVASLASYCHTFDLSQSMRSELVEGIDSYIIEPRAFKEDPYRLTLARIQEIIEKGGYSALSTPTVKLSERKILRIAVNSLGSVYWPKDPIRLFRFLHGLKSLLRHSFATAMITFPSHLFSDATVRSTMILGDLVAEFRSFSDYPHPQPSEYHGLFYLHKTPQVNSLVNVGLRPVNSGGSGRSGGSTSTNGAANDLAFKLRRKKLVIETFHLPIEGGTSDRRTTPAPSETSPRTFNAPNRPPPTKSNPLDF